MFAVAADEGRSGVDTMVRGREKAPTPVQMEAPIQLSSVCRVYLLWWMESPAEQTNLCAGEQATGGGRAMQLTSRRASRPDERFSRESDVRGHELQTLTTEGDEEGDGHEYSSTSAN